MSRRLHPALVVICLVTVVVAMLIAAVARVSSDSFPVDQQYYLAMARAPFGPRAEVHQPPFCWRLLPALLAHLAPAAEHGFRFITLASFAVLPAVVFWLARAVGSSVTSGLLAAALTIVAPPIIGLLSWDPIRPDPLATVLLGTASASVVRRNVPIALLSTVALALTKETVLIAVVFAIAWSALVDGRVWRLALGLAVAAVGILGAVRLLVQPVTSYPVLRAAEEIYLPFSWVNVARRLLLATATTWNFLFPFSVWSLLRDRDTRLSMVLAVCLAFVTAQIIVSFDIPRVVACGWPFVIAAIARALDRYSVPARVTVTVALALCQIPWLLAYGQIAASRLRPMEIILALSTVPVAVLAVRYRSASDQR
jgi:hypothetical protein